REPTRPDPSSDRLFGPSGPPRCLTNSKLLRRCHATTLLQQLLLHQLSWRALPGTDARRRCPARVSCTCSPRLGAVEKEPISCARSSSPTGPGSPSGSREHAGTLDSPASPSTPSPTWTPCTLRLPTRPMRLAGPPQPTATWTFPRSSRWRQSPEPTLCTLDTVSWPGTRPPRPTGPHPRS